MTLHCINIYCGTTDNLTRHHLIPKPFRFGRKIDKVPLCEDCHKKVHRMATNTELALYYNTKEAIVALLASDKRFRVERVLSVVDMRANGLVAA